MSDTGWAAMYRSIRENWVWEDKPFSKGQAWIDLILTANHEDVVKTIKGRPHKFEKGTISISQRKLAELWGWSRTKVIRFLHDLEATGMVEKKTTDYTIIKLVNWDKFQKSQTKKNTTNDTTDKTTDDTTGDTLNNNDLTIKQLNNNRERSRFTPPSLQEVIDYCIERKNNISPQKFINYYESNGWHVGKNHMKDWKAAVRTWEQRDKEEAEQNKQKPKNQSLNFMQREYTDDDIKALERKKLGLT